MADSADIREFDAAVRVLNGGGIITHATEGVFGLAARADNQAACARVSALKGRAASQQFIVIGASADILAAWVELETPQAEAIQASWPGPHTWILPAKPPAPAWLLDPDGRLAVRVTGHAQSAALCRACGPLISTSANRTGEPAATSLETVRGCFGDEIDCYLEGQTDGLTRPSRICDGETGAVIRP